MFNLDHFEACILQRLNNNQTNQFRVFSHKYKNLVRHPSRHPITEALTAAKPLRLHSFRPDDWKVTEVTNRGADIWGRILGRFGGSVGTVVTVTAILVAEDDPDICDFLTDLLETEFSALVTCERTGSLALHRCRG